MDACTPTVMSRDMDLTGLHRELQQRMVGAGTVAMAHLPGVYSGMSRRPRTSGVSSWARASRSARMRSKAVGSLCGVDASAFPSATEKMDVPSLLHLHGRCIHSCAVSSRKHVRHSANRPEHACGRYK